MDDTTTDFDIKRYVGVLQRRRYMALAIALGVLTLFTIASFVWPKSYVAGTTVFIEKSSLINPLIQGVGVSSSMEDRLRNVRNGITSRNIIEKVVKKLGMDAAVKSPGQLDGLIAKIQKNLMVTVRTTGERETDLFTIFYQADNPMVVRSVVETLVNEYIEESVKFQRTDAIAAYDFIDSQLKEYKNKLEDSDKEIRAFREKNPNMIPQSETTIMGRIENFQTSRIEAQIRLKELLRKRDSLQKQLSGEKELTVAFVTSEGSPESRLNRLNNQFLVLLTKYTEDYPEVIKVKIEIEELKKQIAQATATNKSGDHSGAETSALNPVYQQLREELAKTNTEIESLQGRVDELMRQQNEGRQVLGRMPKEQEEWSRLQRDRVVIQKIYDDLLQKLENARVSKNLELMDKGATMRVVDPPVTPRVPSKPDRVIFILLGMVCGVCAGGGVVIGLDYLDTSFKDEDALKDSLQLPVLASIPSIVTKEDVLAEAALDKKVFIGASAYVSIIGLVLLIEILYRYVGISIFHF